MSPIAVIIRSSVSLAASITRLSRGTSPSRSAVANHLRASRGEPREPVGRVVGDVAGEEEGRVAGASAATERFDQEQVPVKKMHQKNKDDENSSGDMLCR